LAGQLRIGIIPLLQADEVRNECFIEATRFQLRKNFESSIGETEFTLTENEKVKTLTLANQSNYYYITIEKDTTEPDLEKIIKAVKTLLINTHD
jgi:phosphoribosylformylglycinamidine (FGAM) synthase PurS component